MGFRMSQSKLTATDLLELHSLTRRLSVVISTGLIALVDDSIKRRWHSRHGRQLLLPISRSSSFRMNMEYIGPKRLIDEVFNRSAHHTYQSGDTHLPPMARRVSAEA